MYQSFSILPTSVCLFVNAIHFISGQISGSFGDNHSLINILFYKRENIFRYLVAVEAFQHFINKYEIDNKAMLKVFVRLQINGSELFE